MNEYEVDCEVCETTVVIYVDSPDEGDEPCFCPMCGSSLLPQELTDV
jgi:hypothetical protein